MFGIHDMHFIHMIRIFITDCIQDVHYVLHIQDMVIMVKKKGDENLKVFLSQEKKENAFFLLIEKEQILNIRPRTVLELPFVFFFIQNSLILLSHPLFSM